MNVIERQVFLLLSGVWDTSMNTQPSNHISIYIYTQVHGQFLTWFVFFLLSLVCDTW